MKFQTLVLFFLIGISSPCQAQSEKASTDQLNKYFNGKREVNVEGGRIDILTDYYAIEVEKASNWKEAIGQALWYALQAQEKTQPGIVLLTQKPSDYKYVVMLSSTLSQIDCNQHVRIWEYRLYSGALVTESNEEVFIGKPPLTQMAAPPQDISLTHWLTNSSKKRHNKSCTNNYGKTNGRWCTPGEGIACKNCGG